MNCFPTNARDRWLLLLFPFKAYIFAAPICYVVWEFATSEYRIRGAREEATGIVGIGYVVCFLVFAIAGVLCSFLRNISLAMSAVLFAVFAFFFPIMIYDDASIFVIAVAIFVFGMKFVPNPQLFTPVIQKSEDPFECPVCGATIPGQAQKCFRCTWTYLD